MARGTLDDFTDKYGFEDGATSENRDYAAREIIVRGVNKLLKNYRAFEFDRPGFHNSCMICFAPAELFKGDEPLDKIPDGYDWDSWQSYEHSALNDLCELEDKDGMEFDFEQLIAEAYCDVDDGESLGECFAEAYVSQFSGVANV